MPNAKNFFYDLHDAGYVIFSKEANFVNGGGGVEFAFLKLSTDFFVNNTMYSKIAKWKRNEVVWSLFNPILVCHAFVVLECANDGSSTQSPANFLFHRMLTDRF